MAIHNPAIEKSKLGKAITYLVNQRVALKVCLTDSQAAIRNNVAERSIQTLVIGRKVSTRLGPKSTL
ncbi:hypothetical protein LDI01_15120 [Lentilactobacillus diolivorans]|uniref:Transposase IS66 central domain-containing protein n=2 Tax=Lentilactobacillus diolivorans TaxID=179838 RepID=A0A0R1SJ95_9LACO|nr:hypothetical protein FC85_GL001591 [Lentilactobacillus diolivorans DSM 14421]GEP23919.1 hypothetical protein LDI01_15120 [Lentilactobacillus diolivorans]